MVPPSLGSKLPGDLIQVGGTPYPPSAYNTARTQSAFEKIVLIGKHGGEAGRQTYDVCQAENIGFEYDHRGLQ